MLWESCNPHGAGTFVYHFDYMSRNRHRNVMDSHCVSSWSPLDWFGYLHELYIDIWFTFKSLTDGCVPLVLFVLTDGERDGLWWPALPGHWLSFTGFCQYLLYMKCLMYGLLFLQLSTSLGCFHPRTFFLKKTDWTSFYVPLLYHFFILYSG